MGVGVAWWYPEEIPCLSRSKKLYISIVLSHPKTAIDNKSCNQVHATFIGCRTRRGILKKYPRQVEAKNRPYLLMYYLRYMHWLMTFCC